MRICPHFFGKIDISIISKAKVQQLVELLPAEELRQFLIEKVNSRAVKPLFVKKYQSYFEAELATEQYVAQIRIAQAERNKDLIVATAKEIYQQTRFHDEKSYALLKETIYKYEWEAFIEDFAQTIKLDQYSDKFAYICIEEGWHDRLLQFLQKSGDLEKIRRFQAYLLPNYANELVQLYIDHAKALMRIPNPQRKTYFQLRRVLQWAQEMGGTEKVKSLIEEAHTQYGDKPLLLAALDRI